MRGFRTTAILIILLTSWVLTVAAQEKAAERKKAPKKGEPIIIVSDRLDAYNEEKLVVFSGNVVATQLDRVIKADRILVFNKKDKPAKEASIERKSETEAGDIERIEAKGNVRVTQGERIVTGEDAVFFNDDQKIIMTGNPVMREGVNVIRGDRIIVLLDEDRGIVESSKDKRVTATLYPDDKNKKK